MTFSKYTFLMLGLASIFSFHHGDAVASVGAGYFQKNSIKTDCRPGCYCEGGSNVTTTVNVKDKCSKHQDPGIGGGVKLCPDDFPRSDANAKSITDCYMTWGNKKFTRGTYITCDAGTYLPKDNVYCDTCPNNWDSQANAMRYCPGIAANTAVYSSTQDQGIKTCPVNQVANSSRTGCVSTIKCEKGKYLPKKEYVCKTCPSGYRCPGGDYSIAKGYVQDQGLTACASGYNPNPSHTECVQSVHCDRGSYLPANQNICAPCPRKGYCAGGNFLVSPNDSGVDYRCGDLYIVTDDGRCQLDTEISVRCAPGEYLPANDATCKACQTFKPHNICPGGMFYLNPSQDQGVGAECDNGATPNHTEQRCAYNTVSCISGEYLPKNSRSCTPCPKGKVCLGGTFETMRSIDQGADGKCTGNNIVNSTGTECVACEFGKVPNSAHTSCVSAGSITVNPGYFLPKGSNTPKGCTGTSRYCPGGSFNMSQTSDQGIENCPANSRTTEDKTACAITLTKKQMMYGINGTGGRYSENALQCWSKNGDDYKACMGFKTDGTWTAPQSGGGTGKITAKPVKLEANINLLKVQDKISTEFIKESPRK